jgi:hypothetical protein
MKKITHVHTRVKHVRSGKTWLIRNYEPGKIQYIGIPEKDGKEHGASRYLKPSDFEIIN